MSVAKAKSKDTEALARRATERLQALHREADRLAAQESTLLGDLRKLEIERQLRAEELKRLASDATKVEAESAKVAERMAALETEERDQGPELRARLVAGLAGSSHFPAIKVRRECRCIRKPSLPDAVFPMSRAMPIL